MPEYTHSVGAKHYRFADLKTLLAKATPARAGDRLAGIAAESAEERVAAQMTLAALPLDTFLREFVIDYDADEVTRVILDDHDGARRLRLRSHVNLPMGADGGHRPEWRTASPRRGRHVN